MDELTLPRPRIGRTDTLPEIPPHLRDDPSPLAVCNAQRDGERLLAVVCKVAYRVDAQSGRLERCEDEPLGKAFAPHEPLADGRGGSMRVAPEMIAWRNGTDVVLRAQARPEAPASEMRVGLSLAGRSHVARVFGERSVELRGAELVFSEPAPFDVLPLRWEYAYGGFDPVAVARTLDTLRGEMSAEEFQRSAAMLRDVSVKTPPIAYARNPYGLGYVCEPRESELDGLALPRIERDDDRLTPDRLICPRRMAWTEQPLPIGFDFMDLGMFPNSAMLGFPPASDRDLLTVAEVERAFVGRDFCRGSVFATPPDKVGAVVNPDAARLAPLGLRFGLLTGAEEVTILGVDHERPSRCILLPAERPAFTLPLPGASRSIDALLGQVFIDVEAGRVTLVWSGTTPVAKQLPPGSERDLASQVRCRMLPVR